MVRMKPRLDSAIHFVRRIEDGVIVVIVLAMILLASSQIVLRNFWDSGVIWIDPLLRVMVLWVGLLGAMAATRNNEHITVDVLSRFLSPRLLRMSRIITGSFAATVCTLLAWQGARFVAMEYEAGVVVFAGVPAWCCEIIIPFGFAVMALRFALVTIYPAAEAA